MDKAIGNIPIDKMTEKLAKEILDFVGPLDGEYVYDGLEKENDVITGVKFKGGHEQKDDFVLPFYHTKAILWLYNNGFDIGEQLEKLANDEY